MRPGPLAAAGVALLPLLVAGVGPGACGPSGPGPSCPFKTPVCPDPQPSYAGQVSAIIQTYCIPCHSPGGQEAVMPFVSLQDIKDGGYAGPMQRQLLACLMPPGDAGQPTPDEKAVLIGWLTCGAPDN
jgi:hypothetical protein